jgi:hypothetical protein
MKLETRETHKPAATPMPVPFSQSCQHEYSDNPQREEPNIRIGHLPVHRHDLSKTTFATSRFLMIATIAVPVSGLSDMGTSQLFKELNDRVI